MFGRSHFAAALFSAALITTASAAVSVIGVGPQKECYDAARSKYPPVRALADCNAALEQVALSDNDRAATYVNRSVLLLTARRTKAALRDTEAALAIIPGLPAASVNRAAALIALERYAEAREMLDRVLPHAEGIDLTRGLYNHAVAAEAMGDARTAYRDYRRIVELDPSFEDARLELARFKVAN